MARIRSLKPDFWSSASMMAVSRDARLFFIGLWSFCDDKGHIPLEPKTLKALVLPGDNDVDICAYLLELTTPDHYGNAPVAVYESGGRMYLEITGWHHQRIDKPQKNKHPLPEPTDYRNATEVLQKLSGLDLIGSERIGKDRRGKDRIWQPVDELRSPTGQQPKASLRSGKEGKDGQQEEIIRKTMAGEGSVLAGAAEQAAEVLADAALTGMGFQKVNADGTAERIDPAAVMLKGTKPTQTVVDDLEIPEFLVRTSAADVPAHVAAYMTLTGKAEMAARMDVSRYEAEIGTDAFHDLVTSVFLQRPENGIDFSERVAAVKRKQANGSIKPAAATAEAEKQNQRAAAARRARPRIRSKGGE